MRHLPSYIFSMLMYYSNAEHVPCCSNLRLALCYFVLCSVFAGGFYSQLVKPGLRVVSLNTILYYGPNKVTVNMTDPAGQFEWLEKTLERAAQSQEKVSKYLFL